MADPRTRPAGLARSPIRRTRSKPSNSSVLGRASDHPCARCGRRAESWHHRLPEGRGGPTDRFNCVPLCGSGTTGCHGWVEHHPDQARADGWSVPGDVIRGVYRGPSADYKREYPEVAA